MNPKEQGKKRRKWTDPKTVREISESKKLDSEKFGDDLINDGKAFEIYGQTFTDEADAERFLKRKIREEKSKYPAKKKHRLQLSGVGRKNAGVLDAQLARSDIHVPKIEKAIARIKYRLESGEVEGYERGRLERDLKEFEVRLATHGTNQGICVETLNKLFIPKSGQSTEGDAPEA